MSEEGNGELIIYVTYIGGVRRTADDCKQLLFWLDGHNIKYTKVDLGMTPEKRTEMEKASGRKDLPQLFVDDTYIGSFEDVEDWVENEKLIEALQQAGANIVIKSTNTASA